MCKFVKTVHHPKAYDLSMDIELFDSLYCGTDNCCDGFGTLEEAEVNVLEILEYKYSGEYYEDQAEHLRYAQAERFATTHPES